MKFSRSAEYNAIIERHRSFNELQKNPFIAVRNVVKNFDLEEYIIRAVDHISFEIEEHEYVAIIGTSGAGKTTLLHLMAGLDKSDEGETYISHIFVTPMEEETRVTFRIFSVGIVFQSYNLISSLTAIENIMFPMQLCGMERNECEERATILLTQIGLSERKDHLPFQLSAGEQQRVAIARALAMDPPIIIADEPTANLDKKNAEFIAEMFENLRKQGKTIIVATHDEKLINYAHRILRMEDGSIISDEKIKDVIFTHVSEDEED